MQVGARVKKHYNCQDGTTELWLKRLSNLAGENDETFCIDWPESPTMMTGVVLTLSTNWKAGLILGFSSGHDNVSLGKTPLLMHPSVCIKHVCTDVYMNWSGLERG